MTTCLQRCHDDTKPAMNPRHSDRLRAPVKECRSCRRPQQWLKSSDTNAKLLQTRYCTLTRVAIAHRLLRHPSSSHLTPVKASMRKHQAIIVRPMHLVACADALVSSENLEGVPKMRREGEAQHPQAQQLASALRGSRLPHPITDHLPSSYVTPRPVSPLWAMSRR